MASWNGYEVVRHPPEMIEGYPDWRVLDCGCCNGLAWSVGTEPIECSDCRGGGRLCVHLPTRTVALYPGGPLCGWKASDRMMNEARSALPKADE